MSKSRKEATPQGGTVLTQALGRLILYLNLSNLRRLYANTEEGTTDEQDAATLRLLLESAGLNIVDITQTDKEAQIGVNR